MANEGIRLPSDSTVASQKVHRGNSSPSTQVNSDTPKEISKPSPLSTVVLQSNAVIQGKADSLFELVLQNEPKSAPAIKILSDSHIQPGTSLLLELDENQQYRPIDKPNAEQLAKLVKLELDFWRAHLLPKADPSQAIKLPALASLKALSQSMPSLKPLVLWLSQSPQALNGRVIQSWLQQFAPLTANLTTNPAQTKVNITNNAVPANLAMPVDNSQAKQQASPNFQLAAMANNAAQISTGLNQPNVVRVLISAGQSFSTQQPAPVQVAINTQPLTTTSTAGHLNTASPSTSNSQQTNTPRILLDASGLTRIADFRLNQPVGLSAKVSSEQVSQSLIQLVNNYNSLHNLSSANAPTANKLATLNFSGQILQLSGQSPGVSPSTLHSLPFVRAVALTTPLAIEKAAPIVNQTSQASVLNSKGTETSPKQSFVNNSVPQPMVQQIIATGQSHLTLSSAIQTARITPSILNLQPPANIAADSISPPLLLNLWLKEVDKQIARSPAHLTEQLKLQAEQLLQQQSQPLINSKHAKNNARTEQEDPLLSLRSWLETTQARMQQSAVNFAQQQWSGTEPNIQQMQLPLIWLGLTQWVDLEWWQERPRKTATREEKKQARNWRMKLYLTLDPLAKICADIQWSDEHTQLTFWSKDANTLAHLNQLLPTLNQWTEGLGEKTINTKHGMPEKASAQKTNHEQQHLVDIRT